MTVHPNDLEKKPNNYQRFNMLAAQFDCEPHQVAGIVRISRNSLQTVGVIYRPRETSKIFMSDGNSYSSGQIAEKLSLMVYNTYFVRYQGADGHVEPETVIYANDQGNGQLKNFLILEFTRSPNHPALKTSTIFKAPPQSEIKHIPGMGDYFQINTHDKHSLGNGFNRHSVVSGEVGMELTWLPSQIHTDAELKIAAKILTEIESL